MLLPFCWRCRELGLSCLLSLLHSGRWWHYCSGSPAWAGCRGCLNGCAGPQGPGGVEAGSREGAGECGPAVSRLCGGRGDRGFHVLPWGLNLLLEDFWNQCVLLGSLLVCGGFITFSPFCLLMEMRGCRNLAVLCWIYHQA